MWPPTPSPVETFEFPQCIKLQRGLREKCLHVKRGGPKKQRNEDIEVAGKVLEYFFTKASNLKLHTFRVSLFI